MSAAANRVGLNRILGWGIAAVLSFGWPLTVLEADEWPDGIVDRSMQVDVWPDRIEIELSFGMSDGTIEQILAEHDIKQDESNHDHNDRLRQVQAVMMAALDDRLVITVNGEPLSYSEKSTELSAQHHIRFFCHLIVPIEGIESPSAIRISDSLLPTFDNQLRNAFRGRRTDVVRSNVPPLVVRAERIYLNRLSMSDQADARVTSGIIRLPDQQNSTTHSNQTNREVNLPIGDGLSEYQSFEVPVNNDDVRWPEYETNSLPVSARTETSQGIQVIDHYLPYLFAIAGIVLIVASLIYYGRTRRRRATDGSHE